MSSLRNEDSTNLLRAPAIPAGADRTRRGADWRSSGAASATTSTCADRIPTEVMSKLQSIDDALMGRGVFGRTNLPSNLERTTILQFVGEEYATSKGAKAGLDWAQKAAFKTASGANWFLNRGGGELPLKLLSGMSESWIDGNVFQRGIARGDPTLHDVGPANIKIRTALALTGSKVTNKNILHLAEMLETDEGTAGVARAVFREAHKDLKPFLTARGSNDQAAIIVDYMRSGKERFWEKVQKNRGLSPEQLEQWKKAPDDYRRSDGTAPNPLAPPLNEVQINQVRKSGRQGSISGRRPKLSR